MRDKGIVLTGATGFLGRELVRQLLARDDARLVCLVRGRDDADAKKRIDAVLVESVPRDRLDDARRRTTAIRADLEKPHLGLDRAGYRELVARTGAIIHGAASVSFTMPLAEARAINVEGTRKVLDLAEEARARVDYVGTAYVAGDRRGVALESELDVGQPFRNTYEQTKMEAEKLVQARARTQPIAIFRPSIIVGDSATGRTASFKVLYWPLKVYAKGLWRIVPGRPQTPVDVVPSDYVTRAILALRESDASLGRVYNLAAGPRASTLAELTELASRFFGVKKAIFVNPELFVRFARPLVDRFAFGRVRDVLVKGRVYTPYLSLDLRFDTTNARAALAGTGIEVPPVTDYFENLLRYAVETDWGRRPIS